MNLTKKSISGAKIEHHEKNYKFGKHLHMSIEMYLIESGKCLMDVGNQKLFCAAGDFILILPHTVHSFYVDSSSDCTFSHIHFMPDVFSTVFLSEEADYPLSLINALTFSCNSYFHQEADPFIAQTMHDIIHLYSPDDIPLNLAQINLLLMNLLLHILKIRKDVSSPIHKEVQSHYISFTLDYISKNYMNKIIQAEIASSLHISVRYLSKLFGQYMGLPLSNYINLFRINKSILLMENTDMTLTEIALAIGLSSSQHFSKLFTDIIDMTPSSYRKQFLTG